MTTTTHRRHHRRHLRSRHRHDRRPALCPRRLGRRHPRPGRREVRQGRRRHRQPVRRPGFRPRRRRHLRGVGDRGARPLSPPRSPWKPASRRRTGQHRGHDVTGAVPGDHPRPVEQGHGSQRHRHLPRHQGLPARHDRRTASVASSTCRRCPRNAAAAYSARCPTRRPRPPSSASPRPSPARSPTPESRSTPSHRARSTPTSGSAPPTSQEAELAAGIPVGRIATTEEIAAVITFLSSEDASYLTGTTVDINGGSHMH